MVCTHTDQNHGATWLIIQDDDQLVAVIRLTASMLESAPSLHTMIGVGWVRITQVTVTRNIDPGIVWELDTTSNSILATALPELTHPKFSVTTQERVCEGECQPDSTNSASLVTLMYLTLPVEWTGITDGRPWFTPYDKVYVHMTENDFTGPWHHLMGTSVIISFIEVKKFVQPKWKKFWPGEICVSISTTLCSSIVDPDQLSGDIRTALDLIPERVSRSTYMPSDLQDVLFVPLTASVPRTASPSPYGTPIKKARSPSQTNLPKKESKSHVSPARTPTMNPVIQNMIDKHRVVPLKNASTTDVTFHQVSLKPDEIPLTKAAAQVTKQVRTMKRSASPKVVADQVPWGVEPHSIPIGARALLKGYGKEVIEVVITGGGNHLATLEYGDPITNARKPWKDLKPFPE